MKAVAPLVLLFVLCFSAAAQAPVAGSNTLEELRDKRSALLVVFKSRVVDVSDREHAIIEDVLKADPQPKGRYQWVYTQLAKKLNKYIHKYKSLSAATGLSDAGSVIRFDLVEFRWILDLPYSCSKLFVIVKGSPETLKPPRVV